MSLRRDGQEARALAAGRATKERGAAVSPVAPGEAGSWVRGVVVGG